ncbi:hypothetical protein [Dokdonella sp.]|uniref:hypothetical protein n=1 Tax=Dokdonella sp. TaxID=2291710 RepID=UPI00261F453B|nr:hypothetical protein [Dokdonella sp.]
MQPNFRSPALALALTILAACSQSQPPPAAVPAAPPASQTQGKKELELYRQLLEQKSYELAAPIGAEIVQKFPQSDAAKEVQQTLADITAKAGEDAARRRLERLWSYQASKESGAEQIHASIYSSDVAADARVRLILRRHAEWGQSVYLFGSGKGFECKGLCSLDASFDDKPTKLAAYLPDTGEPAIFIKDDKAFIAKMAAAKVFTVKVTEKGKAPRTLKFEVGGYDASKFPPLKKNK